MSNIMYLSKSTIPSRSANSVHVMKMCQALANENNNVTLYSYKGNHEGDIHDFYGVTKNFQVIRTKKAFLSKLQPVVHLIKVRNETRKNTSDFIYSRDLLSMYFLKDSGIPFAFEAHSYPNNRIKKELEKRIFSHKNFKFLGVISQALKQEYLKNHSSQLKDKIIVIPDGADIPGNSSEILEKNQPFNHSFEIHDNRRPQIGYIGHLYKGRGIDIVIEVARRIPECDFHIIGGEDKDIEYWVNRVRGQENIKFHGFIPNSNLYKYYNLLDVLLAPYQEKVMIGNGKTDTSKWMSPMKIFEYMSYKKCIISSNLEVLKEVLIDGHNSILVDPTAIEQWVNAVKKVTVDKDLFNLLSTNAYNDLVLKYTWSMRADTILKRFNSK